MSAAFTGEVHPFAERFPMLPDDDLDALADDIRANGLRHPLILDPDGTLLDGRNRLAACGRAGVQPTFTVHTGDPVDLIVSVNVERRHLNTGQRAMARAMALAKQGKRKNGRWAHGAVANDGENPQSWRSNMHRAGVVLDETPAAAAEVLAGRSIDDAYKDAADLRRKRATDEERLTALRVDAPDLAALVDDGADLGEQYAALEARRSARREQRRDARGLLTRILTLAAPRPDVDVQQFVRDWAESMGPDALDDDQRQQLETAIDTLVTLRKEYA